MTADADAYPMPPATTSEPRQSHTADVTIAIVIAIAIAIAIVIGIVIGTLGVALGVALDPARMHPTRAIASALDRAMLRLRLVTHHASSRRCG